jgi:hypothetical protein
MRQFDPNERHALEAAAKEAGFRLKPGDYDYFAMIEDAKHHTPEEILSGEPFLFGRFAVGGKIGYHSISFMERDGQELAQVKDKDGKVIVEQRAQIMVPRQPEAPSPLEVYGVRSCWLEVRQVYDCIQVQGHCAGSGFVWSSCG